MRVLFNDLRRDRRGSTVIEFALLSPVFIMMMMGVLELAMAMQARSALREAVGSVGREAIVSYQDSTDGVLTTNQIRSAIIAAGSDQAHRLKAADMNVTVAITNNATYGIRQIEIEAAYNHTISIPFVPVQTLTFTQDRVLFIPA